MGKIIGIDLGTSNSAVGIVENGKPILIPNKFGSRLTPSAVRFLNNGKVVVGEHALKAAITDPQNTITGIKRYIGRRYNEVMDISRHAPYQVIVGQDNMAVILAQNHEYTPQEISALIIKFLKEVAEDYLGDRVKQAVITVPAYFGDAQREATREAGNIAGLEVLRIINEPTAAAIAYGMNRVEDQKIAVFDLGGGTFDVTLLETGDGVFQVISIGGDGFLGGDDFDQLIIDWILAEIQHQYHIKISADLLAIQRIREAAERAKRELSTLTKTWINLPFLASLDSKGKNLNLTLALTRDKFDELCDEPFNRLIDLCERVLLNAYLKPSDVDEIILVGGATRMPRINQVVQSVFGQGPNRSVHPEEAVALGATIQAAVLHGDVKDILLLDSTSHSLGVEVAGGLMHPIIMKDTTIPTRKSLICTTMLDQQTSVEIHVVEGEHPYVIENRSLGRFSLENIEPVNQGIPDIELMFDIDANGITRVDATDKSSGNSNSLVIKAHTGLGKNDIQRFRSSLPQFKSDSPSGS